MTCWAWIAADVFSASQIVLLLCSRHPGEMPPCLVCAYLMRALVLWTTYIMSCLLLNDAHLAEFSLREMMVHLFDAGCHIKATLQLSETTLIFPGNAPWSRSPFPNWCVWWHVWWRTCTQAFQAWKTVLEMAPEDTMNLRKKWQIFFQRDGSPQNPKIHISPLTCCAINQSRLFLCESSSFGVIGRLSNIKDEMSHGLWCSDGQKIMKMAMSLFLGKSYPGNLR